MMFLMRLALAMCEPDVYALAERLPDRVIDLWREFDCYEPIGGKRIDYNAAMIAQQITRTAGKSYSRVGSLDDFRLQFKPLSHRASPKAIEAALMQWVNAARIVAGEQPYA